MTAQTRSGIERHIAERLGCGGINDLPYIDTHMRENMFELVDQGDVHAAKDIFAELDGFGGRRVGDRNDALHQAAVKSFGENTTWRVVRADHFGYLGGRDLGSGVLALR